MRLVAPVLVALVVLAPTACSATRPVEQVAPTPLPVTPVPAPSRLPGELMRTVLTATSNDGIIEDAPRGTGDLFVHAVCTGPAGSTATYRLLDGNDEPVAFSSTIDCTGQETVSGGRVEGPARITHVELDPSSLTGTEGWAVLSTSAEGAG